MRLPIGLKLPDDLKTLREPSFQELADSLLERRWVDAGKNGLAGKRVEFPGLQVAITDIVVHAEMLDGRKWTKIVHPSQPWVEIAASQTWLGLAATYLVQGIRHILFGADHMLFVLGLLLIVTDRWMLLKTVTAFTVAHSITLAIATLGYADLPLLPLNAAIALSIAQPAALVCAVLLWTQLAQAHIQKGEAAGFLTGVRHPVSGLDHVLAMIAVGLWGAQLGAPAIWVLPVAFPMVMAFGGMLGLLGVPLPGTEYGIAASAILLGAGVLLELRPPLVAAATLIGFFAIFHGYAHGTELPPGQNGLFYSMGFVIATGCLHAVGISIGTVHRWQWGQTFVRAAGGVVAAAGILFLWRALA
ncbi:MAG: HupE/UreJ family protein [Bryobacteraceae bacterium]